MCFVEQTVPPQKKNLNIYVSFSNNFHSSVFSFEKRLYGHPVYIGTARVSPRVIPFTRDKSREEFREVGSWRRAGAHSITVERHSNSILRRFVGRGSSETSQRRRSSPLSLSLSLSLSVYSGERGSPPSYSPGPSTLPARIPV